jgi:photosystem II stability/assembly factor-like uncharacterized protein
VETPEITSADGTTRWRIVAGQVQRSTTVGESWDPMTPLGTTITAGHAPTASVVWFVGKAGAIFVTTDGVQFRRVPFVSSVDLSSIVAIDDQQATVVTVDGGRFYTANRGVTWVER